MFEKKKALLVTFLASSRPTFDNRYNEIVDYLQYKEIKINKVRISALEATEAGMVWGTATAELIADLYLNFEFVSISCLNVYNFK